MFAGSRLLLPVSIIFVTTVFIANIMSKSPYSWRAQAHRGLLMSSELLSLPFQHLLWTSHCIRMFICDALWDRAMRASGRAEIIYLSLSWPSCLPFPRPVSPAVALTVHLKIQELICIKHVHISHIYISICRYTRMCRGPSWNRAQAASDGLDIECWRCCIHTHTHTDTHGKRCKHQNTAVQAAFLTFHIFLHVPFFMCSILFPCAILFYNT